MARPVQLLIVSDIHYAGDLEKARGAYEVSVISSPRVKRFVKWFRHHIWMRDPFAHNHLLDLPVAHPGPIDIAVANGDYSCDSAFIGVSDPPSLASAHECLGKLRNRFGANFHGVIGDHELGKMSIAGKRGGLRIASMQTAQTELRLRPFWEERIGRYCLMGITSTVVALPVYEPETLPEERAAWRDLRGRHLEEIRAAFLRLDSKDRVILFCHDPTALPYLWEDEVIRANAYKIERTIIGHLHTQLIWRKSLLLAGMPIIDFMGGSIRRMSRALHRARDWSAFNVLLCPSLAGSELLKDGGYFTARLDPDANDPVRFLFHPVRR